MNKYQTGIGKGERITDFLLANGTLTALTERGKVFRFVDGKFVRYYRSWWERLLGWFGR